MNFLFLETLGYESHLRLSGHHYARRLAQQNHRVLSVSSPVSPAHWISGRLFPADGARLRRLESHRRGFAPPPGLPLSGILHFTPFSLLPVHRCFPFNTALALRLACATWRRDFLSRLDALQFVPDVISIQSMMFAPLLDAFPKSRVWYRMEDLLAGFNDMPASMTAAESGVMTRADLITLTSPLLMRAVPEIHRAKTLVIPNGVDFQHFSEPRPRPAAYARLNGPVALYVGALRAWFNWDWLESAARALPDVWFVLISPDPVSPSVRSRPNIVYIPGMPYEELPAFIQHAALGLIPFIPSPLIDAVSPIKLLEFFACGKPVVSTEWATLRTLAFPARLASDSRAFVTAIQDTLLNSKHETLPALQQFAQERSWSGNLDRVSTALKLPL